MARALIVGCGCHGRALGSELGARGWRVRGTSRGAAGVAAIDAAGLEAAEADPERPGSVLALCGDAAAVVWLLGSARGSQREIEAIHGSRLERLLEKLVDTPVRGFAYELAGSGEHLRHGAQIARRASETWRIPLALLERDRSSAGWAERTADAIEGLLSP